MCRKQHILVIFNRNQLGWGKQDEMWCLHIIYTVFSYSCPSYCFFLVVYCPSLNNLASASKTLHVSITLQTVQGNTMRACAPSHTNSWERHKAGKHQGRIIDGSNVEGINQWDTLGQWLKHPAVDRTSWSQLLCRPSGHILVAREKTWLDD